MLMAARPPPPQKAAPKNPAANAGPPNQTLYIKNLNDKINRDDLKRALYMLFSTYGPVLDVVTCRRSGKGKEMRGQAHICFRDIQTSTQAMRALQNFDLFGKDLEISYARGTSHIIPKLRGTFEPPVAPATPAPAESTDLQKSIFNAPPSGIPAKPATNGLKPLEDGVPHGTKRGREEVEQEEEEEDVAMDEDEDDAPMEEDDDD
ncbi:hypothetical protein LTR70_000695 [Exophiala xenobiotica]|uniref:RRM domain-containing protein n=1 Tax=Lithohypha guttulata TaxID=1690604 RepID=A0ABR0KPI9_9EURO|nr:hypothetical protein LTR24_000634 [Lithohypha guttulata]KAK5329198.1 hypothetical protein LTR70_000695 [Exophiala xenobiotica]